MRKNFLIAMLFMISSLISADEFYYGSVKLGPIVGSNASFYKGWTVIENWSPPGYNDIAKVKSVFYFAPSKEVVEAHVLKTTFYVSPIEIDITAGHSLTLDKFNLTEWFPVDITYKNSFFRGYMGLSFWAPCFIRDIKDKYGSGNYHRLELGAGIEQETWFFNLRYKNHGFSGRYFDQETAFTFEGLHPEFGLTVGDFTAKAGFDLIGKYRPRYARGEGMIAKPKIITGGINAKYWFFPSRLAGELDITKVNRRIYFVRLTANYHLSKGDFNAALNWFNNL